MRFVIDCDIGDVIRGWIAPDNPFAISRVVVSVEGQRVAEVSASIIDDAIRLNGWHATGQCVFVLTNAEVPNLPDIPRLEIYDADTNVQIYCRDRSVDLIKKRVFLINTSIEPDQGIINILFGRFQHKYFSLQNLSDEIITSLLTAPIIRSALFAGNMIVPRYENYMTPDLMLTCILLEEPYVEMATRMRWLQDRSRDAFDPNQSWRLGQLAEAARFASEYDYTDAKSLKRFFRMMPEAAYRFLYNPLTRQLGTRLPEDPLHPGNSIAAIEVLARIGVVGHKNRYRAFAQLLFDQLGLDRPVPSLSETPVETQVLAQRLRAVRPVAEMLIFDIALADAVVASVDKGWGV